MVSHAVQDYRLDGPNAAKAIESGLAGAQWYACPVPRKQMKELMKRKDGPAIRDTIIWFLALGASGTLAYLSWGTWWAVPAFTVYGVLYGSCGDSRWHECGHGTAFRTPWLNTVVYYIGSFLTLRNGTLWKWSHARHHTDTIIVGRDPEIAVQRPPSLPGVILDLLYLRSGSKELGKVIRTAFGKLSAEEKDYVPETERGKVILESRIYMAILLGAGGWSVAIGSILPLMFIGLPTFYGIWLDTVVFGYTQHAGLAENVTDHRLNTRTVYLNPISRFIYWNMNYHLEHHMFPMVPYHALPKLHEALKDDTPPPYPSLWAAWKEILPAIIKQTKDPSHYVVRTLPPPNTRSGSTR